MKHKNLALCAVLTALALALSYIERLIPLQAILPLPGVKLGLANIVTLSALVVLDKKSALMILSGRVLLGFLLFGSLTSFLMSLAGGLLAFLVTALALRLYPKSLSLLGVGILGAAAHNIGQVICASMILKSGFALYYLPLLLFAAILTGALSGALSFFVIRALKKAKNGMR